MDCYSLTLRTPNRTLYETHMFNSNADAINYAKSCEVVNRLEVELYRVATDKDTREDQEKQKIRINF